MLGVVKDWEKEIMLDLIQDQIIGSAARESRFFELVPVYAWESQRHRCSAKLAHFWCLMRKANCGY